jgi:O-antigen ligase
MLGPAGFEAVIILTSLVWIVGQIRLNNNPLKTLSGWPLSDSTCGSTRVNGPLFKAPLFKALGAVYLSILVSVLLNGGGDKGYLHDIVIIRHLFFMAALMETSRRFPVFKYLFYGILAGFVYALANIVFVHLSGSDFMGKPLARYLGKEKEGVRYPTMLTFYILFYLTWGLLDPSQKTRTRGLVFLAAAAGMCFLAFFHIRTVHLALVAGILFLLVYFTVKKKNMILLFSGCAAFAGISYALFTTNNFQDFNSLYDRFSIWKASFLLFRENPFFGAGISSYTNAVAELIHRLDIKPYFSSSGTQWFYERDIYHAHNNILQILSCTGIFGFICSAWLAFVVLGTSFKNISSHGIGFIAWPVLYFVISFAGFSIYTGWYLALASLIIVCVSTAPPKVSTRDPIVLNDSDEDH